MDLIREIQAKAMAAGLYAANMPEEVGGAGLDTLSWLLYEKELGRANYALHWTCVARPSNILLAGNAEQRERYLMPCIRGETWDCLAMTEPGAGSDLRGMKASARQDGGDWVLNGTKHFISHADLAGFAIVFMASGEEDTPRGRKKLITAFFVDKGTPGFTVRDGYRNVSHRGYTNAILEFDNCRVPAARCWARRTRGSRWRTPGWARPGCRSPRPALAGPSGRWAMRCPMPQSASSSASRSASSRACRFKLADMAMELKAAELLTREAAWKYDQGTVTEADMSMAKLKATEVLAMIADEAIQIHGGMGLMDDLPLERIWRDARVERIWEGTSRDPAPHHQPRDCCGRWVPDQPGPGASAPTPRIIRAPPGIFENRRSNEMLTANRKTLRLRYRRGRR